MRRRARCKLGDRACAFLSWPTALRTAARGVHVEGKDPIGKEPDHAFDHGGQSGFALPVLKGADPKQKLGDCDR